MKKIVQILLFLGISMGYAQNEEAFQRGNSLYNQEKYQEAIDAYQTIIDAGNESTSLYYNLANAHYKLSNIGPSIYYYEKALQLSPNDEDAKNNLIFAQKTTIDAIDVIPEGFISRTLKKFTNIFSFDGWAWFSICCVILFVLLFMVYHNTRSSSKKRLFFAGSWLFLCIGIAAIFFAFRQYYMVNNNQYAIVFAQKTVIKSEPNLRSEQVFELHEGTKVSVIETVNDWKKIKLADGKIGWIPKVDIKEL